MRADGHKRRYTSAILAIFGATLAALSVGVRAADTHAPIHFVAANDDTSVSFPPSTVSIYPIRADGSLASPTHVSTGGNGIAGGYFGINRLVTAADGTDVCVYASNAQSENISGIDARAQKFVGVFPGSRADNKLARDGVGLVLNGSRLYATFSGAGNIGTFQVQPGCKLQFVGDVHAQGLNHGRAEGIAARGTIMVVAYGDGSIESFNTSGDLPVSNGDAQNSTGSQDDLTPGAVEITRDGRYAIFGGGSTASAVEVSDLASGKLAATTVYRLGTAWNSGSVHLSPDESMLFVSNNSGGRVTAAFFDKATGKVRPGCTSAPLKGFYTGFTYIGGVATEFPTGTGGLLYVPEFGEAASPLSECFVSRRPVRDARLRRQTSRRSRAVPLRCFPSACTHQGRSK